MELLNYTFYVLFTTILLLIGTIGFVTSKKHKLIYAIFISFVLAIIAYNYVPPISDDLYRHHQDVYNIMGMQDSDIVNMFLLSSDKGELLSKIVVAKTGNVNLLQFGITFLTYILIFLLIIKMTKGKEYSTFSFLLSSLFAIVTISYITVISNLYFTLSILFFCFAIYEYYINNKKIVPMLFVLLSFLLHSSMIVAIVILLMYIFCKNKLSFKSLLLLVIMLLSINVVIPWLYATFDNTYITALYNYYDSYFLDSYNISRLHSTTLMIIYYLKLVPFGLLFFMKKYEEKKMDGYAKYVMVFIIAMGIITTYSIRFIPIVQMLGYPKITEYLNSKDPKHKKNKIAYSLIIIGLIMLNILYQYKRITSLFYY